MSVPEWKVEMAKRYLEVGDKLKESMPYFNRLAKDNGLAGTTVNHFFHNMKKRGVPKSIKEAMGIIKPKEPKFKEPRAEIPIEPIKIRTPKATGRRPPSLEETSEWRMQICRDLLAGKRPKVAATYFGQLCAAFGAIEASVRNAYYKYLKDGIPDFIVEAIQNETKNETKNEPKRLLELTKEEMPATPLHPGYIYKNNSLVQIKVMSIQPTLVMVETTDKYKVVGIIHISNIRNQFIKDINDWFKIGQVLVARVVEFNEFDNRLQLSTKTIPIKSLVKKPDPVPEVKVTFQEQLLQIKTKIEPPAPQEETEKKPVFFMTKEGTLMPTTANTTYINTTECVTSKIDDSTTNTSKEVVDPMENEWKQAKLFIEGIVGTITPAAEDKFKFLLNEHSVFAFTLALMEQKDKVKADLGLMLANQVAQTICKKELL